MSRIGKKPIALPAGVEAKLEGSELTVNGPKGRLAMPLVDGIGAEIEAGSLVFSRRSDDRHSRANHGLVRALAANMVKGVSVGFTKKLEIQGVGYRAEVKGGRLVMNLGYSHPVEVAIPADITIESKDNKLTISGIDNGRVGQIAANIRSFRPPDRYKGKGVRYEGEHISIKAGKSA